MPVRIYRLWPYTLRQMVSTAIRKPDRGSFLSSVIRFLRPDLARLTWVILFFLGLKYMPRFSITLWIFQEDTDSPYVRRYICISFILPYRMYLFRRRMIRRSSSIVTCHFLVVLGLLERSSRVVKLLGFYNFLHLWRVLGAIPK